MTARRPRRCLTAPRCRGRGTWDCMLPSLSSRTAGGHLGCASPPVSEGHVPLSRRCPALSISGPIMCSGLWRLFPLRFTVLRAIPLSMPNLATPETGPWGSYHYPTHHLAILVGCAPRSLLHHPLHHCSAPMLIFPDLGKIVGVQHAFALPRDPVSPRAPRPLL